VLLAARRSRAPLITINSGCLGYQFDDERS
jgi:hypothetical protein